jgi:hypothetical protein
MTSEPESAPRRRPPTIDLTATEIPSEKPAAEPGASQSGGTGGGNGERDKPGSRAGGSFVPGVWTHAGAVAAGAGATAAVLFGLWVSGIVPSPNAAQPAANNDTSKLAAQLDRIQTELQSPRPADSAFATRLAAVEAQTKTLSDSLNAVTRRLDGIAVAAQSAGRRADAATAAAKDVAQNSVKRSDLEALANRIDALQRSITALSETTAKATATRTVSAHDRAARAAIAAEALRAVVERGAPFQAELAAVKSFGADPKAVAALEPFAAGGVPSAADLGRELAQLIPTLQPATPTTPNNNSSFLGRLEDNARNLVHITPANVPAADDSSSAVRRLAADATRADIAAALADIGRLPPAAKAAVEPWVQKAKARNGAIAASRRIAADALTGLGGGASTTSGGTQ